MRGRSVLNTTTELLQSLLQNTNLVGHFIGVGENFRVGLFVQLYGKEHLYVMLAAHTN